MCETIEVLGAGVEEWVHRLVPDLLEPEEAASVLTRVVAIRNALSAAETLLSARVALSGVWRKDGDRSAAHFLARTTGRPVGQAVGTLEAARKLEALPTTEEAFRSGEVSEAQVKEIASAAIADPRSEQKLLQTARSGDLTELREECRKVRAAATDEIERYEAIRRSRFVRPWSDHDGAFRLDARFTPDGGATVMAGLEPHYWRILEEARRAGRREPREAYLADALVALAEEANSGGNRNGTKSSGPRAMVSVRVDHSALVRGHVQDREVCQIDGVGPIPVVMARAMMSDSILSVLVTKGADVRAVAHHGRTIPARIRRALEERDPECVVPGCHVSQGLEIDHIVPLAEGGQTCMANLARECQWHHAQKTYGGFQLGGGPGGWTWTPPDDPVPAEERAPP